MTDYKIGKTVIYKWIKIALVEKKEKTNVYWVTNSGSGRVLGVIQWYGPWRQYSFNPCEETVFNRECLTNIVNFMKQLMAGRKISKKRS